jgi:hypothetical protein
MKDKPEAVARRQNARQQALNEVARNSRPSFESWQQLATAAKNGTVIEINKGIKMKKFAITHKDEDNSVVVLGVGDSVEEAREEALETLRVNRVAPGDVVMQEREISQEEFDAVMHGNPILAG